MKLPIGISDFKNLIEEEYVFVDKSLFIRDIMKDGAKVILITRPRRFGKTLNLSMLNYFLSQNHYQKDNINLFETLNISKEIEFCKQHQEQYPVVFITFKDTKYKNYSDAYDSIANLLGKLYSQHRYLLEGDLLYEDEKRSYMAIIERKTNLSSLQNSILQLSEYLKRKFNKSAIILIDEYDTPIQEAYLNGYYDQMVELMRGILGYALKDNPFLAKAVLTGITRISQASLFSGLNNIIVYSLLQEQYGQYFGFSEKEVSKLLSESKQSVSLESIREWYDGYQIGQYELYNPWSIINCLQFKGELRSYWANTGGTSLISKLLLKSNLAIKQQIEELLKGNTIEQPISENLVFPNIETREEALWSLLLYAGYLKVLSSELKDFDFMVKLAIPNKEIAVVYNQIVKGWFSEAIGSTNYLEFLESLVNGQMIPFKKYLSEYLMHAGSYYDFNINTKEQIFAIFVLGLIAGLKGSYHVHSNQEAGLGRFDIVLIPEDKTKRGVILELKTCEKEDNLLEKAKTALVQIKEKRYIEIFKEKGIHSVLAIGLAFCGKNVELVNEII